VTSAENDSAISQAMLVVRPLDELRKPEIYFSNSRGEIQFPFLSSSEIVVHLLGYSEITDTILVPGVYSYRMEKLPVYLSEVVVTGQYDINTSDQSVYRVKVIDAKTINRMAAQNLRDVLVQQLNVRVSQDNILGGSASINGVSGQNVKILVDGVPVIGRQNGNIDIGQINLNSVERIEVIEGPMSVSYGTDALGGLINIITKKSSSYPLEAEVNGYYESVGTYNADAAFFLRHGNHGVSVNGGRYFFDGYSETDTSRHQDWKPKQQLFGTINYSLSALKSKLSLTSEWFGEEIQNKGVPVVTPYQAYAFDDYYFTRRLNETILFEQRLNNNASVQLTNAYNNYRRIKNSYRMDLVTLNENLSEGAGMQDTSAFTDWMFRGTYSQVVPGRKLNFQAGYDVHLQTGEGNNLEQGKNEINDYAAFGSFEYELIRSFFLRPAARLAYNTRYGVPFTPSLNLKYEVNDRYTVRASYAHGFRAPSLKELDLDFVDVNHNIQGNDSLDAETADHFEISFAGRTQMNDVKIKTDVSLFFNSIRNIITLASVTPATTNYTYINLEKYKTYGLNFSSEFHYRFVKLGAGFSLLNVSNLLSDSMGVDAYSMIPQFQSSLAVNWPKVGLDAAVFFTATGSTPGYQLDAEGNVQQTFLESYSMMDFTLAKYLFENRISVSGGVKNILNVTDLETNVVDGVIHSGGGNELPYALGRYFFLGMKIHLVKQNGH
jgi:outer membrane receptor for ferrienterochelin and colicins